MGYDNKCSKCIKKLLSYGYLQPLYAGIFACFAGISSKNNNYKADKLLKNEMMMI